MEDRAVVIITFDGYRDVWNTFFECYNKFWAERNVPTYLVTNETTPIFNGVQVITTGTEISWSRRVRTALSQIKEEKLLVLLEDYFFCEEINNNDIDKLFFKFDKDHLDYLRLIPIPYEYKHKEKGLYPLDERFIYGVNLQASIWRKEYLKKLLYDDDFSAWEFEARQKNDSKLKINGKCATLNYVGLNYLNGVIQGKWYPKTVSKLKKSGIVIDTSKRDMIHRRKLIPMYIQNWLLHHIPKNIINSAKPLLSKMGVKFVTK